jgi:hypothetical protein
MRYRLLLNDDGSWSIGGYRPGTKLGAKRELIWESIDRYGNPRQARAAILELKFDA